MVIIRQMIGFALLEKNFIFVLVLLITLLESTDLYSVGKTYNYITSANGYSAVVFDESQKRTKMFFPHIYKNLSKDIEVKNLLYDTYFGLSYNNKGFWLSERDEGYDFIGYLHKTGIIHLKRRIEEFEIDEYIFSPMSLNISSMIMLIRVKTLTDIGKLSIFSLHNFHMGLNDKEVSFSNERIIYDQSDIFIESSTSSNYIIGYKPLVDGTVHSANPINPYNIVKSGGNLTNVEDTGIIDDAVCGFEKDYYFIKEGDEVWFGVLILYYEGKENNEIIEIANDILRGKSVQDFLSDEIRFWENYFNRIDSDKKDIISSDLMLSNAVVLLKMAQVREENTDFAKPNGQIVASLPPGMWNITWLRDMMYSLYTLIEIGAKEEVLNGIKFVLNADVGYYRDYVGVDYRFSVCRYYGNGVEESDWNEDGPNIEFDGAGLFLIAVAKYVSKYGVSDLKDYISDIFSGFADVLLYLIDEEGLIKADSSIWERHLNGKEKHFTYTQLTALSGLCGAIYLAESFNLVHKLEEYKRGYEILRKNIFEKLVHKENFFVSSLEEFRAFSGYLDAAVIESINFGIVSPEDIIAKQTLYVMKNLKTSGGGYKRNDDGDWYDRQEWVFVDLRIAEAMRRMGLGTEPDRLLERIKEYTEANNFQFPELITEDGKAITGSIPMIGFGAGAYLLAVLGENYFKCSGESPDGGVDFDYFSFEGDWVIDTKSQEIESIIYDSRVIEDNLEDIPSDSSSCSCNIVE